MTQYLIESLLKKNLVNTIVGPSGSGKSKWVMQQLKALYKREPFFGYAVNFVLPETLYISLDRASTEAEELVHHAGMDNIPQFHYASWRKHLRELNGMKPFLDRLKYFDRRPELLVVDGVGFVVKDIIKQREVGILFADLDDWLEKNPSSSVILIHHTAKQKMGQGYLNPREQGMGSGAWAQCSGISISISHSSEDFQSTQRIAVIMSNNREQLRIPFYIDTDGSLKPLVSAELV